MSDNKLVPDCLKSQFWLVSADMGYGHQRAIYPLKDLARVGNIINANKVPGAAQKEIKLWQKMLRTYEFLSRAGSIPFWGTSIARILNKLLYIPEFYPLTDRSRPTFQVYYLLHYLKKGLCKSLTEYIKVPELPLITSFYSPAVAAGISGFFQDEKNVTELVKSKDILEILEKCMDETDAVAETLKTILVKLA